MLALGGPPSREVEERSERGFEIEKILQEIVLGCGITCEAYYVISH